MKRNTIDQTEPISAYSIARRINRSAQGVMDAIARLDIKPIIELPSGKYYSEECIEVIAESMRRPNVDKSKQG